ncbi:unnamed protein product, partial [Closterium sp. Naga37s-1]
LHENKVTDRFNTSTDRDYPEYVQVSLHFEEIVDPEIDTNETVPGSESAVSCTTCCSDTTKCDIKNRDSSLKDFTILLKNKGIDLSNECFHVLQVELERVATMTPKAQQPQEEGLLEYLEKAVGTNKFIEQIKETAQRLEDLNERRVGFIDQMRLAEREKDQLEEHKKAAEAFLLKEAQHTQLSMAAVYLQLQESEQTMKRSSRLAADLERVIEAD